MPETLIPHPADVELCAVLVEVRDGARHAADPREPAAKLAAALLAWFDAGAEDVPAEVLELEPVESTATPEA